MAQLPSRLQPGLEQCLDGPNRAVTADAIETEIGRALGLEAERAAAVLRAVCKVISDNVAPGQIENVRAQMPEDMKDLFPPPSR